MELERLISAVALEAKLKETDIALAIDKGKMFKLIDAAPTVEAEEVKHGRWIDRPSMKGQVYCSECATIEKASDSNFKSKRCPNCGARMDGGRRTHG